VDHEVLGGSNAGRVLALALVGLLAAAPRSVRAQAADPARAEVEGFVPPDPLSTPVEYPKGATGSAEVVLELAIDREGAVAGVKAVTGEPPFTDAAVEAARKWKFVPGLRGSRTVAVRLRYTVTFEPPAPVPEEKETPVSNGGAPRALPVEVVVHGERPEPHVLGPGTVTLSREEARMIPGTFGDPLRAVEAQPGVVPIVSGLPQFFVRGAPPANVGFFIDGIEVPLLYHAFFGPSVLHPGLVDSMTLHGGAPPVQYGRYAGPVVSAELTPLARRFTGEASVRIIDAGVLGEVPFGGCEGVEAAGCSRGSMRLSGRYSYSGLLLSLLGDAELDYWDYQAQAAYALGAHDEIGVFAFGALDHFESGGTSDQGGGEVVFHRADVRWDHKKGGTALRVGVTGGFDETGGVEEKTSQVKDRSLRVRGAVASALSESVTVNAGVEGRVEKYEIATDPLLLNFADYSRLFPNRTETSAGAYASLELRPTESILVVPGLRSDLYHDRGVTRVGVDPRIAAEFQVRPWLRFEQSLGLAHQRPNFVPNIPGAQVADLEGGLQEAWLYSTGVALKLPASFRARATAFRNGFFRVLDPLGRRRDFGIDRTVIDHRSTIRSAGLELKIERPVLHGIGGFFSYTLSRTVNSDGPNESVTGFDRTHVAQLAMHAEVGWGVSVGFRSIIYSGVPELNFEGSPHFTDRRRGRPYFRTDVRANKRWKLGGSKYIGVTADVLNATVTREVVRLDCGQRCLERFAGPVVLPSIGVEGGF
jgi:TonB family protein